MAAPAEAPLPLGYDELPPGSDLSRAYGDGGAVTITAPAGEPSASVCRGAAHGTGVWSATVTGLGLAVGLVLALGLSDSIRRLDSGLRLLAAALFLLFCGGVFLLVWRVRYAARLEALAQARRQAVVLDADGQRLLVETAGPPGPESLDIPADQIRAIGIIGYAESVLCLGVHLGGGTVLKLMPGRHPTELRWVAAALVQALGMTRREAQPCN